jgi:hypothetical protein
LIDVEASVKVKAPVPAVLREIVDPEWWERGSKQTAALERGNGGMNNGDKEVPFGFGPLASCGDRLGLCSGWDGAWDGDEASRSSTSSNRASGIKAQADVQTTRARAALVPVPPGCSLRLLRHVV